MTDDGHVRPLRVEDLREVAEQDKRIQQLEAQCATLAAQVDRMRPVIEAAQARVESLRQIHPDGWTQDEDVLVRDVTTYERQMAQLASAHSKLEHPSAPDGSVNRGEFPFSPA
jgi:multidrug resistance efflux pump